MSRLALLCLLCCMLCLSACTTPFWAYIRNMAGVPATIDVFLLDKAAMKTLPNQVKVVNKIVVFKSGFRQSFYKTENVHWIDTTHFSFTIQPGVTADLTDMAGRFVNANPREQVCVTVTINTITDTLINGRNDFRFHKFGYKKVGLDIPVLYYDVK